LYFVQGPVYLLLILNHLHHEVLTAHQVRQCIGISRYIRHGYEEISLTFTYVIFGQLQGLSVEHAVFVELQGILLKLLYGWKEPYGTLYLVPGSLEEACMTCSAEIY